MRYVLTLEAIGDNYSDYRRRFEKSNRRFDRRALTAYRFGNVSVSPWCAKVTGITSQGQLYREFIEGSKDYTFGDAIGSRGVYFYYSLEPGIYEINEPAKLGQARRYFAHVIDHETLIEITKEEALQWLQRNANAI